MLFLCFSFNFDTASPLLHGHIALATPSLLGTDPQILERWGYADEGSCGQITPSDGFLVSVVGVTQHGFCELRTLDWLQYV